MDISAAEASEATDTAACPELREISDYIAHAQFRKRLLGGCDEEDVMKKLQTICGKYEALINRIQAEYAQKNQELLQSITQVGEYRTFVLQKAQEEAQSILTDARLELEEQEKKLSLLKAECEEYQRKAAAACAKVEAFKESIIRILEQTGDADEGTGI